MVQQAEVPLNAKTLFFGLPSLVIVRVTETDGTQSLNVTFQMWLSRVNATQDFHNKFYMPHASGFKGREFNATSSINLPFCEMWVTRKESGKILWQQYQSAY